MSENKKKSEIDENNNENTQKNFNSNQNDKKVIIFSMKT